MSFIIISDIHFCKNTKRSDPTKGKISSWLDLQFNILDSIFDYAQQNNVKTIIHNGDLFEEKNKIDVGVYNSVWRYFYEKAKNFEITFNTGNHDIFSSAKESSLQPFVEIGKIVDLISYIRYKTDEVFVMIPYGYCTNNALENILIDLSGENIWLFIHTNLSRSDNMIHYDGLDPNLLREFKYIFNGHIHCPDEFDNVINIGSIMQHNFKEADEPRRFIHVDDDLNIKSIPVNCPNFFTLDALNNRIKNKLLKDNFNYYRVNILQSQIKDEIFDKYNVYTNEIKNEERVIRLKQTNSVDEELEEYINIKDINLDKNLLLKIGKILINGELI